MHGGVLVSVREALPSGEKASSSTEPFQASGAALLALFALISRTPPYAPAAHTLPFGCHCRQTTVAGSSALTSMHSPCDVHNDTRR